MFNKRAPTLVTKAHELAAFCGAKVYLVIDHPRATVVYNSTENTEWPPPDDKLVQYNPVYVCSVLTRSQNLRYRNLQRISFSTIQASLVQPSRQALQRFRRYCIYRAQLLGSLRPGSDPVSPGR